MPSSEELHFIVSCSQACHERHVMSKSVMHSHTQ